MLAQLACPPGAKKSEFQSYILMIVYQRFGGGGEGLTDHF